MPTVRFQQGAEGGQSFVREDGGFFIITLILSQASSTPVSIVVRPFASAVDGADMDLRDVTVTFAPGATTATYRAQIYNDAVDEIDENVFFEIVSATNATVDLSSTDAFRILGRIIDDDVPPGPLVRFMAGAQGSQSFVSEGGGSFLITLSLSQAASVPVTVVVRPLAGAVDGADMNMDDMTVTFAPGQTSATYRAAITDDTRDESDENVFFELVSVTNATIDLSSLDAYRLLGRILDNDVPSGPTVRFAIGAQGSQSFVGEDTGYFTIALSLSQPVNEAVTVVVRPFASGVDGADMDLRDVTVTFAPGQTSATYRAAITDDIVDETDEALSFELVSVTNATIDLSSFDAYRILGCIIDNDGPLVSGTPGSDLLTGSSGDDVIDGLGGDDLIVAAGGNDQLYGRDGDDVLDGGAGADILVGGAGSDIFRGTAANLASDRILDFVVGERIVITDVSSTSFTPSFSAGVLTFGSTSIELPGVHAGANFLVSNASQGGVELSIQPQFGGAMLASPSFGSQSTSGGWSSDTDYPRRLADVNGDAWADIVGFGHAGVHVSLGSERGFATPVHATPAFGAAAGSGGWSSDDLYPRHLADVNGDGCADIVGFGNFGAYVALGNATGGFAPPFLGTVAFGAAAEAGGWSSDNLYHRELADVNGDGRADAVGFGNAGTYVALDDGNGRFSAPFLATVAFGVVPSAGNWSSQDAFPRFLGDANGDGRADIVGFGNAGVYLALANADGTFANPFLALDGLGAGDRSDDWTSNNLHPRAIGDVNGDGHLDIIGFGSTGVILALGRGDGSFEAPMSDTAQFGSGAQAGGWTSADTSPRYLADVDHNGAADIVAFAANGVMVALSNGDIWL